MAALITANVQNCIRRRRQGKSTAGLPLADVSPNGLLIGAALESKPLRPLGVTQPLAANAKLEIFPSG